MGRCLKVVIYYRSHGVARADRRLVNSMNSITPVTLNGMAFIPTNVVHCSLLNFSYTIHYPCLLDYIISN